MSLPKPMRPFAKSSGSGLLDLPDVEVDEAHGEHVVGEEGELVLAVGVVRLEGVPQELDVLLLLRALEGERQVVAQFGGFFHGSRLRRGRLVLAPDAGEGGLDLLLEAGDQFAVGGDQRLLGFDLGDDGLLRGEGWEGNLESRFRCTFVDSCAVRDAASLMKSRTVHAELQQDAKNTSRQSALSSRDCEV